MANLAADNLIGYLCARPMRVTPLNPQATGQGGSR